MSESAQVIELHQRDEPLHRTLRAEFLNKVVNDPSVRPGVGGTGVLDLSPVIGNPVNVTLVNGHGGFVLRAMGGGLYEAHTQFLPTGRGARAFEAAAEGFRYMFLKTDCLEVTTRVAVGAENVEKFTRMVGFREVFQTPKAWVTPSGQRVDAKTFSLTFDEWKFKDSRCREAGERFHKWLEGVKLTNASAIPTHPDDSAHDSAVGACVLMALEGNTRKGVWLYNRWAACAGYSGVNILSETPLMIDVVDAIIAPDGLGWMECLLCR